MLEAQREHPKEPHELLADRAELARVRAKRWSELLGTFTVRDEILDWAERMAALYGPEVRVWENRLGWIAAFYVARFGENEAYWPAELSDEEVARALQWEKDPSTTPKGVRYIPRGG